MTYRKQRPATSAVGELGNPYHTATNFGLMSGGLFLVTGVNTTTNRPDWPVDGKANLGVNGEYYVKIGDLLQWVDTGEGYTFNVIDRSIKTNLIEIGSGVSKTLVGKDVFPYETTTLTASCGLSGNNTVITLPPPEMFYLNSLLCIKLLSRPGTPALEIKVPEGVVLDGVLNGAITDKISGENTTFRALNYDEWIIV
jgi:hypothetical protein